MPNAAWPRPTCLPFRHYGTLAGDPAPLQVLEQEFARSVATILDVTEQRALLEHSPLLARSIQLRNPYVDVLHATQVDLLRRVRGLRDDAAAAERRTLLDALHHTMNGIAAGLQTTG